MPSTQRPHAAKATPDQRRQPLQARAQQTIQTLFKAAAQILDREGEAALTTNKVAATAGFSIGTLYQYFPSKEVLLRAMAVRGQGMVLDALEDCLCALEARADVASANVQDVLRQVLRIIVQGFATGKGFSQSLIRLGWSVEQPDETASVVRQVADRLAIFFERIAHPQLPSPTAAQLFVLTRSVIGTLRSASLEKSPLLGSVALEDALVQVAVALLVRPGASRSVADTSTQ